MQLLMQSHYIILFHFVLLKNNAVMSMGIDYSLNQDFSWTSILVEQHYVVEMLDFQLDGISLGFPSSVYNTNNGGNSQGCIVDSGTLQILLPEEVFDAFISNLQNRGLDISMFSSNCVEMSESQVNAYPNIQIILQEIDTPFTITPDMYLFLWDNNSCRGGGILSIGGNGLGTNLGDIFMQGWHVVFDRENSKVGFGPLSSCPSP